MKIHIDVIIYENIDSIIQLNDEKWRKNSVIGVTSFYFLNGRSMISQEFMARDLLARILTQFRWWVHNEPVIFVKSLWDKEQQSKAQNWDSKYRQMALTSFDT